MNEQYVREVLDQVPMGAFLSDVAGNCFFTNRELERISGLSSKASAGRGWFNVIVEEDRAAVSALMEQSYHPPYMVPDHGFRIRHPESGIRHVLVKGRVQQDAAGAPQYMIGYVQDVTEEWQNMQQLRKLAESLERLNQLMDESQQLSKTGGWEYDLNTREVHWTPQTRAIMVDEVPPGFTPTFENLLSFCDETSAKELAAHARKAISDGLPYDCEIQHVHGKWLRVIGVPVTENNRIAKLRGAVMDITDKKLDELMLKKTKNALTLSKQLLDISQELSKTGGWELNLGTGQVFWTKQTYAIYGLPEDYRPTFDGSMDFFDPDDCMHIQSALDSAVKNKTSFILELRTITPAGEKKWVRVIGVPLVKQGEVVLMRGAIMDITAKKEDELALISARDKAEDAARAKSEFLSVMSHEIRTPLNGIIGTTSLLQLDHTPEQEEYINNLAFSANHLLALINDILDLHKAESGNMELEKTLICLPELVKDIISQFRPMAESRRISLVSHTGHGIPPVLGDPMRLNQILNNLVGNSLKYTEEGEVVITLRLLSVTRRAATVHFSVKDTGVGIPEALHKTIFESFKQVQQASTRKHSGTGLGLAITKKLVELHDSRIFVRSKAGEGAEFYFNVVFDLPVQQSPVRPARASAVAGYEKQFAGIKMLFVEDNYINVVVAKRQLEHFGIIPDCAQSASEAMELLAHKEYHIALLDLHMPETDGYTLAAQIQVEYPHIHIIIFTADIMNDVRVRLSKMNIHDILHKPFMPEEMLSTLQRAVALKQLGQER